MSTPFVTYADLQARHPGELAVLAADETTRQVDPARVDRACEDVSTEIRGLLGSRYSAEDLDAVDAGGAALLKLFAIDMALFRVAYAPRVTETIRQRYDMAVSRLRDMGKGIGALSLATKPATPAVPGQPGDPVGTGSPNEILITANERLFTRRRYGGAA